MAAAVVAPRAQTLSTATDRLIPADEKAEWKGHRRWLVLFAFCLLSSSNAFLLMDFADDYALSEALLHTDTAAVAFLYSLFLICVMPAMFVASWAVVHYNMTVVVLGSLLNAAAAWLRYASAIRASYVLAIISTVIAGFAAAVIVCSYAVIAERWFRPAKRGLATSIAVQSNYLGWAFGSLIGLMEHGSPTAARTLLLDQAVVFSSIVPIILIGYRAGNMPLLDHKPGRASLQRGSGGEIQSQPNGTPQSGARLSAIPDVQDGSGAALTETETADPLVTLGGAENPSRRTAFSQAHALESSRLARDQPCTHNQAISNAATASDPLDTDTANDASLVLMTIARARNETSESLGVIASARQLLVNRCYLLYGLPSAIIGGVGFAVPSAQDVLFGESCYVAGDAWRGFDTLYTTFTNLAFIISGVAVGIGLGAALNTATSREKVVLFLAILGAVSQSGLAWLSSPTVAPFVPEHILYPSLVVLMAITGASTIGFIGPALSLAVELGSPVSEVYSVGGVEWFIQGVGGALSTISAMCNIGFLVCVVLQWTATAMLAVVYLRGGLHRIPRRRRVIGSHSEAYE